MVTQFDEKGKLFTQVVTKHRVSVTIYTGQNTIQGFIYIRPGLRVKDELNGQERFLAVTDAVVCDSKNREKLRTKFMIVNIDQIVWITPLEEIDQ